MNNTLALCTFTSNRSKEKVVAVIMEDIGFALCYDVEQLKTVMDEFRDIPPSYRREYQRQINLWISGKDFPKKWHDAPKRVVVQDFGGMVLSYPLMAFASSDYEKEEVTDPEFRLPENPKKLN